MSVSIETHDRTSVVPIDANQGKIVDYVSRLQVRNELLGGVPRLCASEILRRHKEVRQYVRAADNRSAHRDNRWYFFRSATRDAAHWVLSVEL